jgi:hypothetical protein
MIAVYRIYRKDSSKIKQEKHGDVLLCVENDIIICDCDDLNEIQAESIWCKIVNKTDKSAEVVVGVCYRRPAAEAKEIEELFQVLQISAKGDVLIMGDLNYPGINCETFESNNH